MKIFIILVFLVSSVYAADEVEYVHFSTQDGGVVYADYYLAGKPSIVLAHGAIFNRKSWAPLIEALRHHKISVLAIDFRGYGESKADALFDKSKDVLAAIDYLKRQGHHPIAVLGASMGGAAAGEAAIEALTGDIQKLILLSPAPFSGIERLKTELLLIASEKEAMISTIKTLYKKAPEPKKIVLLKGRVHAQHIFKTDEKEHLLQAIIGFVHGDR